MIVSVQSLAAYLEQNASSWSNTQYERARQHILTAGDEVRGALATLYLIPTYTRAEDGVITLPAGVSDPERTALGPIVKMLAAAFLLNPSRGVQPQEERSASTDYRTAALKSLRDLQTGAAFIAPLSTLADYGITSTEALDAMLNTRKTRALPLLKQQGIGYFGTLSDPEGTGALEQT